MKNSYLFFLLIVSVALYSCGGSSASDSDDFGGDETVNFNVTGSIPDASGLKVFFDKSGFDNSNEIIETAEIGSDGKFNLGLEEKPEAGVYRMRIGAKRGWLVLDGNEQTLDVSGNLTDFDNSNYTITGSDLSNQYKALEQKVKSNEINVENFPAMMEGNNGLVNALLAYNYLSRKVNNKTVGMLEKAEETLKRDFPTLRETSQYSAYVGAKNAKLQQLSAGSLIPADRRKDAREIKYPSPAGKKYALSGLEGKVVLVDFWASWCRPCRMANPHVVGLYDKYNKKGFEVYSVSLDRDKARWEKAIKDDKLSWEYHVSDLKQWQSQPAKEWGVSGIPKTFLIDKNGKIAAVNPRGQALENAIEELVNG